MVASARQPAAVNFRKVPRENITDIVMTSRSSPRVRRLRVDHDSMKKLDLESTILSYNAMRNPPELYHVTFRGVGLWRMNTGEVALRNVHEVTIELAAAYPRLIPNLSWKSPIFHPNISSSGVVCLGGYGTNWVPSLTLDELCTMLWDMIRYKNFDTESPYNKDAAIWTRTQSKFQFPLDDRSLRDQISGDAATATIEPIRNVMPPPVVSRPVQPKAADSGIKISTEIQLPDSLRTDTSRDSSDRNGEDDAVQIVNASIVDDSEDEQDILFID